MARKTVCDVCGKECFPNGSYQLIYRCFIRTKKEDICFDCFSDMKKFIQDKKKVNGGK